MKTINICRNGYLNSKMILQKNKTFTNKTITNLGIKMFTNISDRIDEGEKIKIRLKKRFIHI